MLGKSFIFIVVSTLSLERDSSVLASPTTLQILWKAFPWLIYIILFFTHKFLQPGATGSGALLLITWRWVWEGERVAMKLSWWLKHTSYFRGFILGHGDKQLPPLYQGEVSSPCSTWAAAFSSSPAGQPAKAWSVHVLGGREDFCILGLKEKKLLIFSLSNTAFLT